MSGTVTKYQNIRGGLYGPQENLFSIITRSIPRLVRFIRLPLRAYHRFELGINPLPPFIIE
jgi:hypothetical protein